MQIVGCIILGIVLVAIIVILVLFGRFVLLFNHRPCPHCYADMTFRGEKERKEGNIYLFHCPKCGAWEEVPKEELDGRVCDWISDLNIM